MPELHGSSTAIVLDAAERIFLERGFTGTRLRDIADALGIRPASLYHHAPGGKHDLWTLVVDRALERHRVGLTAAAGAHPASLRDQLRAMLAYLLDQPPVNIVHLAATTPADARDGSSDAPALSERLYLTMMVPVAEVYRAAQARGEATTRFEPDMFAGVFLAAANGLAGAGHDDALPASAQALTDDMVDLLLMGIGSRVLDGEPNKK